MPREGKAGPTPTSTGGGGQCWLKMRLWCPQLCEETWPQCLVEGRGYGIGVASCWEQGLHFLGAGAWQKA